MQKKLIALAVAGLASTGAFAQSNVTIYGLLQPSYDFISVDNADDITDMTWNNSRIGFKGEENIGNGLKAVFQIESKVEFTEKADGADSFGDRDSFVGLSSAAGTVTFGNHQSAYKKVADFADPFADSIADYNNIMGVYGVEYDGGAIDGAAVDLNGRYKKSVYYTSPNFGGFQAAVSFALRDQNNSPAGEADDLISVGGTYTAGGLTLMAGYENQGTAGAGVDDIVGWKIGGGYKFGIGTKVALIWENISQDSANIDTDRYFLSVSHPITSNIDLNASYTDASESDSGADDGATAWALGVDYKFSKRTSIQGIYAAVNNDSNGNYFMDSNSYGGSDTNIGADVDGFSVRLRHSF